jgi:hypothetical protein
MPRETTSRVFSVFWLQQGSLLSSSSFRNHHYYAHHTLSDVARMSYGALFTSTRAPAESRLAVVCWVVRGCAVCSAEPGSMGRFPAIYLQAPYTAQLGRQP